MKEVMAFLHHVRQNTPSSFAKRIAAELEYDNPELSEWAVRSYRGMRHGGTRVLLRYECNQTSPIFSLALRS
jgi:hypothetical protein